MDALSHLLPAGLGAGTAALLVAASFFTSALTAGLGIGGGVALLSVMGYVLPVAALIPVHGVVQLGSNAGRALVQRAHIGWAVILPFLAGSAAGAAAGATAPPSPLGEPSATAEISPAPSGLAARARRAWYVSAIGGRAAPWKPTWSFSAGW